MLYLLYTLLCLIVLPLLIALVRTLLMPRKTTDYPLSTDLSRVDAYAKKLSAMVKMETISSRNDQNPEKFRTFHQLLRELFPHVFSACQVMDLEGNLLIRWKGETAADPILLMSHMDVVEPGEGWRYPPFSGEIAEGKVWGRGSADTKCSLMALLQAAEELILQGYTPKCDVYLASSCTEEVGGTGGPRLARWLKENGIHLYLLCDEGGSIVQNPVGGVNGHYAAVGIFEKGYGDVRFIARSKGGHASAPGKNTPLVRLGKFMHHVEKHYPFKSQFSPAVSAMFTGLAPYASSFPLRLLMGNLWLFRPLMKKVMPMISSQAAAMLRTTIAFTMASGSTGYNVLPMEASVCANLRFIPHQGTDESLSVLEKLAKKFDLEMEVIYRGYPSAALDLKGEPFKLVEEVISQVFPHVGMMPYVVTGGTDARFYGEVCDSCVRFSPVRYGPEQMAGMHGLNENVETGTLPGAVDYFKAVVKAQEKRKSGKTA